MRAVITLVSVLWIVALFGCHDAAPLVAPAGMQTVMLHVAGMT